MRKTIDQLQINDNEADGELSPRVLRPSNPNAPENVSFYSLKERQFVVRENSSNLILHVSKKGTLMKESTTSRRPDSGDRSLGQTEQSSTLRNLTRNQFEFNERGCETLNPPVVSGSVSTHPPPSKSHSGIVSRSVIQERYSDFLEGSRRKTASLTTDEGSIVGDETLRQGVESNLVEKEVVKSEIEPVYSREMQLSGMQMERILNFNCEQRIYQDLVQVSESPDLVMNALWKFSHSRTRNKSVTAIRWNPQFPDLFAVAYGSFDYTHHFQGGASYSEGFVAIYTLKNVNCPQKIFPSNSVCGIDWHPDRPSLLAVGMYDGNVGVIDISSEEKNFVYFSGNENIDHSDPIWELKWIISSGNSTLAFDSVSSNGRIMRWHVDRSSLASECVFELHRGESALSTQPALVGSYTGLSLDLTSSDSLLIGTEEGPVLQCSQNLQSTTLFIGHPMAVYAVKRNPFDKNIFATCSADWTVKVWSIDCPNYPLCTFETGSGAAVGDLDWSPVVSTMFVTVAGDGSIGVFDINANRSSALLSKKILKKGKLTRVSFNKAGSLVLVGDERGTIYSFKLGYGRDSGQENLTNVVEILMNSTTGTS